MAHHSTVGKCLRALQPAVLIITAFGHVAFGSGGPSYRVKLSFERPLRATVEATMEAPDGKLFMDPLGLDTPQGWAEFVRNLEVRDAAGTLLTLRAGNKAEWMIDNHSQGPLTVRYGVDLSFALDKENTGDLRMGKLFDDALFLVNRSLFILCNAPGARSVQYDLPPDWKISTPWHSTGPRTFEARDNRDLAFNPSVYGHFGTVDVAAGNVTVTLATLGELNQSSGLVGPPLRKILPEYIQLFPDTPPRHVLTVFFYGAAENAEAFSSGSALTTAQHITPQSAILWGNFLAHELFHYWNGQQIRGASYDDRQWMSEGFTEYIANRTIARTGIVSENLFVRRMETHLGMYMYFNWAPPFASVSLKAAGARKGYNRPGVYSGGWAAAFCLDMMIRKLTANRRSIDEFLRLLYQRFGLTSKPYSYEDLITIATDASGHDFSEFFSKYISGTDQLPVLECLHEAAYQAYTMNYSGEVYIFPADSPSPEQRAVHDTFFRISKP